jgi:hypothetical protein
MPDVTIVKLKIRRGPDAQRKTVVLEQGELGFAIDTQRLYIGNGVALGGVPVSNINHLPLPVPNTRTSQTDAAVGDFVYDNSVLWQLTASDYSSLSSWASVNTKGDEIYISTGVNNLLTIKSNSITPSRLADSVVYAQGGLSVSSGGLSANVDNTYISISSNKISLNPINENRISSSSLGNGLAGGDGTKLSVNADTSLFGFNSSVLTLTALPNNTVTVDTLSSGIIGPGLIIQGDTLATSIQTYDSGSFDVDVTTLKLKPIISPSSTNFSNITFNTFGQISAVDTAVYNTLSGNNTASNTIFNGAWDQTTFTNQTLLTAISSNPNGGTLKTSLTSAGYMSIDSSIGVVAIPIFKYI